MISIVNGLRIVSSHRSPLHRAAVRSIKPAAHVVALQQRLCAVASVPVSCAMSARDPSSLSNPWEARVTHSAYELDVDFARKVLEGYVQLDVLIECDGAHTMILDTSHLTIHACEHLGPSSAGSPAAAFPLSHHFGDKHAVLGTPLEIILPQGLQAGQTLRVGLRFATAPTSSAIQFLDPKQTAGGEHPYLFTQCQAIHARALVPCQDSPGAKMTYSAVVRVPKPLTALMSAVPDEAGVAGGVPHLADVAPLGTTQLFAFQQRVPIPPYLLALAVGQLESRELGPRSRVWSEPGMVEAGAHEFAETAKFLDAGEAIAGPYVWGRYDLLLLPPSFPYGGMENPTLTFVTPTLIAGDRSLTNVIAHEIAHSWSGNLVTNASWEHFWLNEGWTVFLERKILGRLHGEQTLQFRAANGYVDLVNDVNRFGKDHPYTKMVPDLSDGIDPDEVFSKLPYEKGFYFLYWLQALVGGPSVFEPFTRAYLDNFKFKTVTSNEFKDFFLHYFKDLPTVQEVDWDAWYYSPGLPPAQNNYDTSLGAAAHELAKRWHTADVMGIGAEGPKGASSADIAGWSSEQVVAFLDKLAEYRSMTPLHASVAARLAQIYRLYESKNAEVRAALYHLAVGAEDTQVLPHAVDFLKSQGRMKYLRPLYRALYRSKMGKELALSTFKEAVLSYHPIAQKMLAVDLHLSEPSTAS